MSTDNASANGSADALTSGATAGPGASAPTTPDAGAAFLRPVDGTREEDDLRALLDGLGVDVPPLPASDLSAEDVAAIAAAEDAAEVEAAEAPSRPHRVQPTVRVYPSTPEEIVAHRAWLDGYLAARKAAEERRGGQ